MNKALFAELNEWFELLPTDHSQLQTRPIILIDSALIQYDKEAKRYFFINSLGLKQFGYKIKMGDQEFLMLFVQLRVTLNVVKELHNNDVPFQVVFISLGLYKQLFETYSQGSEEITLDSL